MVVTDHQQREIQQQEQDYHTHLVVASSCTINHRFSSMMMLILPGGLNGPSWNPAVLHGPDAIQAKSQLSSVWADGLIEPLTLMCFAELDAAGHEHKVTEAAAKLWL